MPDYVSQARAFAASGDYAKARQIYLRALQADATNLDALIELGALAEADGYRQAARSAFLQAIQFAPGNAIARSGLGNLLMEDEDYVGARTQYLAALATDPNFPPAHQGLARCLTALEEPGADFHWEAGFRNHAVIEPRAAGRVRIPLLLLASARGGNVPCKNWIDASRFAVTTLYADFFDETAPLPDHAITLNAIGDADMCGDALAAATRLIAADTAPLINHPDRVSRTSREENAQRLWAIPDVITPRITRLRRDDLTNWRRFPILLRSPGFHTGKNFILAEAAPALFAAVAQLPGDDLLAIEYLDAVGSDGLARKYRVMFIDGKMYPLHLAASADWKVHYFTSAMADSAALRQEEERFLANMPAALGSKAMRALEGVSAALGLDYAGADFALAPDGSVILFEANATMIIHAPDDRPIWNYRRPAIEAALSAAKTMLAKAAEAAGK